MRNHRDIALYFVSLLGTLLLFLFLAVFLVVSAEGVGAPLFSVSQPDVLHGRIEALGSTVDFDYTPLAQPAQLRRKYAPLLTPRPILMVEYAAGYAAYWSAQWNKWLEEYLFHKEAYGPDAAEVSASVKTES